jgi:hypothetical protein
VFKNCGTCGEKCGEYMPGEENKVAYALHGSNCDRWKPPAEMLVHPQSMLMVQRTAKDEVLLVRTGHHDWLVRTFGLVDIGGNAHRVTLEVRVAGSDDANTVAAALRAEESTCDNTKENSART